MRKKQRQKVTKIFVYIIIIAFVAGTFLSLIARY